MGSIDDRMKRYELPTKIFLTRRTPVILRIDGKAFHTFTRGFEKPFDDILIKTMQVTMLELCKDIQGAVLGYTQSDEISIVLQDYKTHDTDAWFDYRLDKVCSIAASKATKYFNKYFIEFVGNIEDDVKKEIYMKRFFSAEFDCRAFNVPKEEVCNALIWRQQDAERNSVQMLAQSLFSHKEMFKVNCKSLQDKMFEEKGVNWNELPTFKKRGTSCIKDGEGHWFVDTDMPILTQERNYVEDRIEYS